MHCTAPRYYLSLPATESARPSYSYNAVRRRTDNGKIVIWSRRTRCALLVLAAGRGQLHGKNFYHLRPSRSSSIFRLHPLAPTRHAKPLPQTRGGGVHLGLPSADLGFPVSCPVELSRGSEKNTRGCRAVPVMADRVTLSLSLIFFFTFFFRKTLNGSFSCISPLLPLETSNRRVTIRNVGVSSEIDKRSRI
jgi:hypothetical protein